MWRKSTTEELDEIQYAHNRIHDKNTELDLRNQNLKRNLKNTLYVAQHTKEILAEYDREFELVTKLQPADIKFVFFGNRAAMHPAILFYKVCRAFG